MIIAIFLILAIIIIGIVGFTIYARKLREDWKKAHPLGTRLPFDYTEEDNLSLLKTIFVNRYVYKRKLIVHFRYDMIFDNFFRPDYRPTRAIMRMEYWVDTKKKDLGIQGYKPVKGLHDSIMWIGVPVYMIVENGRAFEVPEDKDENGNYLYPQDTAETLQDYASSSATSKFIAAMSKAQSLGTMDLQTIIMIVIIGVGAIFGMHILGVF